MFEIEKYKCPDTLEEAFQILENEPGCVVLGGCGYLRLGARNISVGLDLSRLNLDQIVDHGDHIEIGAMTSLRELEVNSLTTSLWSGVLSQSVTTIVGVQLRNIVTVGGSVAGRYAFSDPTTALIALDADVQFHKAGTMKLADFLAGKSFKDILTGVLLSKKPMLAAFQSVRRNKTDYPMLNCAVSKNDDTYRIVVGSRPGRAMLAQLASDYLAENGLTQETAQKAGELAVAELNFGDNPRASKEYREAVCPVLVKRALLEIAKEVEHAG